MMVSRFYGIDFSGNHRMWTAGCRTSNVWIAKAQREGENLRLVELYPVQELLPKHEHPFTRLTALLGNGDYAVAAIDAPFSIPAAHIPVDGRKKLLRDVASFPVAGLRRFAKGGELVAYAENVRPMGCLKRPLRQTESEWAGRGVNVRSTLWDRPRGGAPFTTACLTLIQRAGRPCWPWRQDTGGLLAEAFPAAQLRHWGLPHQEYSKENDRDAREKILTHAARRIKCSPQFCGKMLDCADALDAFLCLFAAVAVADKRASCGDFGEEGWIAVHPKFEE